MIPPNQAPSDWKSAVADLCSRLEQDYQERVGRFARGLDVWGSGTFVGFDVRLGGRVGPMWGNHVRYARRTGLFGLLGPRVLIKDLSEVEAQFRGEIEAWLVDREREERAGLPPDSGGPAR